MKVRSNRSVRVSVASGMTWMANALVILAAFFVAYTVRSLANDNRRLADAIAAPRPGGSGVAMMQAGDSFPQLEFVDLEGYATTLRSPTDTGPIVIGFLTTTCPYCRSTIPAWNALSHKLGDRGAVFRGVSLHDAKRTLDYIAAEAIPWEVRLRPDDPAEFQKLGVTSVPQTIAVGTDGVVLGAWRGALELKDIDDILHVVDGAMAR